MMDIEVFRIKGTKPVMVFRPYGALDASTFRELLYEANKAQHSTAMQYLLMVCPVKPTCLSGGI
ncbi:MAG: hypothetical protein PVF74_00015 [Anaerolineales bacterium]|jgi:hypothetical protein